MATSSAHLTSITTMLPLAAPTRAREPGGITNVRGQTWMESMETEVVLPLETVIFGIRWRTALVESKRPLWWFDVHDDADEFSLIYICNQITVYIVSGYGWTSFNWIFYVRVTLLLPCQSFYDVKMILKNELFLLQKMHLSRNT